MAKKQRKYVIGVDGGGTKTVAALADLNGKILAKGKSGSSNPRNVGINLAVFNIVEAIRPLLKKIKKGKIVSTAIALAATEEEYREKKEEILRSLRCQKGISKIFRGDIKIFPDQIVSFKSGTKEKDGVLLIAGTGSVCHGWQGKKEAKVSGWGWLADEGSAFWIGQKAFQMILKNLDKREPETLLTKLALKEFKVKDAIELLKKVYSGNPTEIIPKFSIICDKAGKKGDKIAKKIMFEAGKELALAAKKVIQELNFQKTRFSLVLIGSVFKTRIVLKEVKRIIRKFAPKVQFIRSQKEPVAGAIELAIERARWKF